MAPLPPYVLATIGAIVGIGLIFLVLIPQIIGFWRLSKAPLEEVQKVTWNKAEAIGIIVGLLLVDIAIFILFRNRMSRRVLVAIIGITDLIFLLFVVENFVAAWIARRRLRQFEQSPQTA